MSWRVLCNQCINSPILLEIPLPQSRVLLITMVIYISNRVIQSESERLCLIWIQEFKCANSSQDNSNSMKPITEEMYFFLSTCATFFYHCLHSAVCSIHNGVTLITISLFTCSGIVPESQGPMPVQTSCNGIGVCQNTSHIRCSWETANKLLAFRRHSLKSNITKTLGYCFILFCSCYYSGAPTAREARAWAEPHS